MNGPKTLDKELKRFFQTRRCSGRRAITPMKKKSKHKVCIGKTRGHKIERKPYVPIRKHTDSHRFEKRKGTDTSEYCEDSERQGDKDSGDTKGWEDTEEHSHLEQTRDTENTEKSVHPGPVQTVPGLFESPADDQTSDKTDIESEELPPWR